MSLNLDQNTQKVEKKVYLFTQYKNIAYIFKANPVFFFSGKNPEINHYTNEI